jgi:hypothetical protein
MGRIIQIENGKTTVYVNGQDIGALTATTDTYYVGVDLNSGFYEKLNPNGSIVNLEAGSVSDTTYADLVSMIGSNSLTPGTYYQISDFQTILDKPDFFIDGNYKTSVDTFFGSTNPIFVLATSVNSIDTRAYDSVDSFNKIEYDINYSSTEIMGIPAKGRITELIDENNNRTSYDHIQMPVKRYQVYERNLGAQTGFITDYDCTTGQIYGSSTLFLSEISIGDILLLDTKKELGYEVGVKVASVNSDTDISVYVDPNYSGTIFSGKNYVFYRSSSYSNYKSYKEVYIGQSIEGDYSESITFNDSCNNNYIGDPDPNYSYVFKSTNNIFGNNCIHNHIESGYNNNIGDYFEYNNIEANFYANTIGNSVAQNKIGSNFSYNTVDDSFLLNVIGYKCTNNIFGVKFQENIIGNYCGGGPDGESNIFGRETERNKIGDYFGLDSSGVPRGNKMATFTRLIYNNVYAPIASVSITNLGTGYVDGTNTTTGGSGSGFVVNITTSAGGVTGVTINSAGTYYGINETVTVTGGGGNCTLEITGLNPFASSTSIDNGIGGTAEITNNYPGMTGEDGDMYLQVIIGDLIPNDIIDDGVDTYATVTDVLTLSSPPTPLLVYGPKDNVIGNYFLKNVVGVGFERNRIGDYFGNDMTSGLSNIILERFQDNIIGSYFGIDVQTPDTGNGGNLIRANFIGNEISTDFTYNATFDTGGGGYYNNKIGFGCNNNIFGDNFNYNNIGSLFQSNVINNYFGGNTIGYFFNVNQIDTGFADNVIGDVSWFNTFGPNCLSNKANSMFGNDITNGDFSGNILGESFGLFFSAGNTINSTCYDNVFGNFCYDNIIGDSCISNNFFNYFQSNTLVSNFTTNTIQYPVIGIDFTSATHVYGNYTCIIFNNTTPILRLSYYDTLDNLVITGVTS